MMSDVDLERFKVGRRFSSILNSTIWKIDKIDSVNDELHVSDDFGYTCRIFTKEFDTFFCMLEDLPIGFQPELLATKCECGSSIVGSDRHSDYCPRAYKTEVK